MYRSVHIRIDTYAIFKLRMVTTASEMGRKGGKARAEAMTQEERSAAASKAVTARWNKSKAERAKAKKAAKKKAK